MKKNILIILLLICSATVSMAQSTLKTAYFMDRMTTRHEFNPALMTEYGYLSIPALGDINFGINSKLSVDKFLYPLDNGELGLFVHPDVSSSEFLSKLNNNNVTSQEFSLSLLSFGFHGFGGFNTFDISVREELDINLKKSLFEFMVGNQSGAYDMSGSTIDLNSWMEISLGHSRKINDNLTVGAKFKYLVGAANAAIEIDKMEINATSEELLVDLHAMGNVAVTGTQLMGDLSSMSFDDFSLDNGLNAGAAIDLGATYQMDRFNFSLAVTDLGFIRWKSASIAETGVTSIFTGFESLDFEDFEGSTQDEIDAFTSPFEDIADPSFTPTDMYTTWLNANLNIGAEYQLREKISVGALWTTSFGAATTTEFITIATLSPASWFDFALSGTLSSYGPYWGWAMNICPRWINFFVGMDSMVTNITPQGIPYSSTNLNFKFGLSIPLGKVHTVN